MTASSVSEIFAGAGLERFDTPVVLIALGLALLVLGRRLYWVLIALAGFAGGAFLAFRLLDLGPGIVPLVIGLLFGAVAAALAVLFQKLAVALVGFVAGGLGMLYVAGSMGWESGLWILVAALAAGLAGALAARSLFELGLIVFTSIAGAAIAVPALGVARELELPLVLGAAALGVVAQLALGRSAARKD